MATEADLIQKFKDLNIPVGADFEELIHAAFAGSNLADQISKEVNAKQDKIGYTPADDSKVAHLSGANNFDTVPTVNNNPLLLASSLPSDLARTGSNQEFTGKNTFDVAPIDKNTGNPYITKDGVPAVPSTLADTTKLSNFTAGLQSNGTAVATKSDVTTAISTATANMVDSTKATNFTAGLQSGGVNVATAADIKSVKDSAWRELDLSGTSGLYTGKMRIKVDDANKTIYLDGAMYFPNGTKPNQGTALIDLSKVVNSITSSHGYLFFISGNNENATAISTGVSAKASTTGFSNSSILINRSLQFTWPADYILPFPGSGRSNLYVTYDRLV